ncbi:MAG: hypothetical protein L3J47_02380 [Sulfurovum sp.]|nr:hypothetical protein [Sulfurovum sp.]
MKEYGYLLLTIVTLFGITLAGAIFSPTFEEQKSFLELFFFSGAVLFIFSALVIFASIGFRSFAIYGAIFLAAVMGIYGIEGALLFTAMTYFVWGSIFAMQVLLFYHHLKTATDWFKARYTFKSFYYEYRVFYPMLWIAYIFLEFIPSILYREDFLKFIPSRVVEEMRVVLEGRR